MLISRERRKEYNLKTISYDLPSVTFTYYYLMYVCTFHQYCLIGQRFVIF